MLQNLIYQTETMTEYLVLHPVSSMQISDMNKSALKQTCAVCMELKSLQDFGAYNMNNCTHPNRTICDNCMYEYVRNTWNIDSDINCPECSVALSNTIIKQILVTNGDSALYERYKKLNLERFLEQTPQFVWCAHGCGSGELNEGTTMDNSIQCNNCHKLTCFKHRCPWHDGMTCEEYEMPGTDGETHASQRWISVHTKECPQCHSHIEKNDGCDRMTCLVCKHEFCWECLASYLNTRQRGAYIHCRTCKHYPPTNIRTIVKRFIDLI